MTGNRAKTRTSEEKSPVEARQETVKILGFPRISVYWGFLAGVLAMLVIRRVGIAVPIVVLLTVWCVGVPIMTLNGKSRIWQWVAGRMPAGAAIVVAWLKRMRHNSIGSRRSL
jgi:hypothetical protein